MGQNLEALLSSHHIDRWLYPVDLGEDVMTTPQYLIGKFSVNRSLKELVRRTVVNALFDDSHDRVISSTSFENDIVVMLRAANLKDWRKHVPAIDPARVYPENGNNAWYTVGVTDTDLCLSVYSALAADGHVHGLIQPLSGITAKRLVGSNEAEPLL